jgi:hypothetical protein
MLLSGSALLSTMFISTDVIFPTKLHSTTSAFYIAAARNGFSIISQYSSKRMPTMKTSFLSPPEGEALFVN